MNRSDDDRIHQTDENDNEEKAVSSPIGRLMAAENNESDGEQSAFVIGFERSEDKPVRRERPAPIANTGEIRPRPRRERPPQPQQESDVDFREAGAREARARLGDRESRRPSNPSPRPAVRAATPTSRRMSHNDEPMDIETQGAAPADVDNFRQRYNPDELISTTRGGARPQRDTTGESYSERPRSPRPAPARVHYNDEDSASLIRWIAFGGAAIVLLIFIMLIVSRGRAVGRYNNLRTEMDDMRPTYEQAVHYQERYGFQTTETDHWRNQYNDLRAQVNTQATTPPASGNVQADTPGTSTGDNNQEPPASAVNLPTQHTILGGQSLTSIAILYYGRGTASENQIRAEHIAAYNNIRNLNAIQVGQTITVPTLP